MPNLVCLTRPSQNSEESISNFQISGQSLIKENFFNSRTSNDIDMNLGPVTTIDKLNKTTSKNFDYNFMLASFDVIFNFPIYGQFGTSGMPDFGRTICKIYIFMKSSR